MRKSNNFGCGCLALVGLAVLILNVAIGGWSVNEILSWFGKDIPSIADAGIGLFTGEFTIPIAVIGKILKICGVF